MKNLIQTVTSDELDRALALEAKIATNGFEAITPLEAVFLESVRSRYRSHDSNSPYNRSIFG